MQAGVLGMPVLAIVRGLEQAPAGAGIHYRWRHRINSESVNVPAFRPITCPNIVPCGNAA